MYSVISFLRIVFILGVSLSIQHSLTSQLLESPSQFLNGSYGNEFTPHHKLVDYFLYLNDKSNNIQLQKYGETYEGRPLYMGFISSEENLRNLDQIKSTNLYNAGIISEKPTNLSEKSIVWLSYSVHGNEAGGSESSMNVAYELLSNSMYAEWLENVVIIMDPSLNPDGYSRYTHWVRGVSGMEIHADHTDAEHMEPWPGGRVNHYLFDLNRDWAWQTQVETQQRIAIYNNWLPHVHADLHEMGYDNHYYFAPAAEPYHKSITDWQRELQYEMGKNHAMYFDAKGWLYFTREIFDLLYPSYGDTWPTFNGSIGMTYEQAGHGMSGRSIEMSNGKNLTLQDRIDHHTATSLSTIEVSFQQKEKILDNFKKYFQEAVKNPVGEYKSYLIKQSQLADEFATLLERNGIEYKRIAKGKSLTGYDYISGKSESFITQDNDIFISTNQPKSTLLQVLMEKEPVLADSVTYDITSWSVPFAYNLTCYGLSSVPEIAAYNEESKIFTPISDKFYAVIIPWAESWKSKEILADLLAKDIVVKTVNQPSQLDNYKTRRGDLVILKGDNNDLLLNTLNSILSEYGIEYHEIQSGFAISGSDMGGSGVSKMDMPKVLTFFGDGVSANSYGQIWHFFETRISYPLSRVDLSAFEHIDFDKFNTIILPNGYYSLSDNETKKLSDWVNSGGKLISIAGANRVLRDDAFLLGRTVLESNGNEDSRKEQETRERKRQFEGAERRSIAGSIPGAIFKTEIDPTHPLCYGIDSYFTLKNSSTVFPLLGEGAFNPVRIPKEYEAYGFIGSEISNNFNENFVFAVSDHGAGKIIYMADNPLFRAFWKSGELIFANAIFQIN